MQAELLQPNSAMKQIVKIITKYVELFPYPLKLLLFLNSLFQNTLQFLQKLYVKTGRGKESKTPNIYFNLVTSCFLL